MEEHKNAKTEMYSFLKSVDVERMKLESTPVHQAQELTKANLESVLTRIAGFLKKWGVK